MTKRRIGSTHDLAVMISRMAILYSGGDPAMCLSAVCEVAAELMKVGAPKQDDLKATFIQHLDRFLKIPNSMIDVPGQPAPSKIILPEKP